MKPGWMLNLASSDVTMPQYLKKPMKGVERTFLRYTAMQWKQ